MRSLAIKNGINLTFFNQFDLWTRIWFLFEKKEIVFHFDFQFRSQTETEWPSRSILIWLLVVFFQLDRKLKKSDLTFLNAFFWLLLISNFVCQGLFYVVSRRFLKPSLANTEKIIYCTSFCFHRLLVCLRFFSISLWMFSFFSFFLFCFDQDVQRFDHFSS